MRIKFLWDEKHKIASFSIQKVFMSVIHLHAKNIRSCARLGDLSWLICLNSSD